MTLAQSELLRWANEVRATVEPEAAQTDTQVAQAVLHFDTAIAPIFKRFTVPNQPLPDDELRSLFTILRGLRQTRHSIKSRNIPIPEILDHMEALIMDFMGMGGTKLQ
jgi:hypothetical protein